MSRQLRQLDELRSLCGSGAVARAVDLAFAHFADFGPDDEVVALLETAIERTGSPRDVRKRFVELTSPP